MLEPGLSDHSFASLLADPSSAMLTGDSPRITNGKKEESELMNGCDVARGGSRGGVSEGSGCGRDMSEHTTQQQHHHHHQQSGPHLPPPPLLPAATTTNGGDKCEGSATPYALPSAPYTLPANPPVLFPPSVFPPHPQQHTSEPREVFSAPFPALTFPLQVFHNICLFLFCREFNLVLTHCSATNTPSVQITSYEFNVFTASCFPHCSVCP
ncbi:hypothetical protein Pcinc_042820 [Petrolisthes cinctipes]|uniref:Uncharacterized protein n=1 Tax=Petrolisthes cinctipes TaxID=88211 RepID=A0AAE1BKE4_PETCI|nr:hypothetical protein Pcinc_042820 [Petrolisthes cinctipes]